MKILLGFYHTLGDFVAAVPVIRHVSRNTDYRVFVAIGEHNLPLQTLIDVDNVSYVFFSLFSATSLATTTRLFLQLRRLDLDWVYVSPHCQDRLTSWKIPIMLKCLKRFDNRPRIVGAQGDRNAWLYDERIAINKSIPLMLREIAFAERARLIEAKHEVYTTNIFRMSETCTRNEIVIHPGASKALKQWSVERYRELCTHVIHSDADMTIRFIGLARELEPIKAVIRDTRVLYETGSLDRMVRRLSGARAVITMDSGFSHIAAALGLPHIALFGSTDPQYSRPIGCRSAVIVKHALECQPCNALYCKRGRNECMDLITARDVVEKLGEMGVLPMNGRDL
jgi:hypothetical protein